MRILVTGGNGYVGRTLTRQLCKAGHAVAVVDNLEHQALRFKESELFSFDLHKADIRDFASVDKIYEVFNPEVVVHLAAIHYIPECEAKPDEAVSINTHGTVTLLRALRPNMRFVLASTAAVYKAEDTPHDELTSPVGPMDIYGYTKWHAEEYVRYWSTVKPVDARIVRLFNVIGPGETNPHLLPAIMAQVLKGTRTLRLGNCHPKRDYIHVDDVARGFAAVATVGELKPGLDTVNLGGGSGYSVYDVVDEMSRVFGEPLKIEVDPARVRASDRPFLMASIKRIADRYGWKPQNTLADALRDLKNDPDIPAELLSRS